jgi:hypothetical protein
MLRKRKQETFFVQVQACFDERHLTLVDHRLRESLRLISRTQGKLAVLPNIANTQKWQCADRTHTLRWAFAGDVEVAWRSTDGLSRKPVSTTRDM